MEVSSLLRSSVTEESRSRICSRSCVTSSDDRSVTAAVMEASGVFSSCDTEETSAVFSRSASRTASAWVSAACRRRAVRNDAIMSAVETTSR